MTGPEVEKLLEQALSEEAFLQRLLADPRATAAELGLQLSDEEASTFRTMSPEDVRTFAEEYRSTADPERRRAAC